MAYARDHFIEPGQEPAIRGRPLAGWRRVRFGGRIPILGVAPEEVVRGAQRVQKSARHLRNLLLIEPLRQPDLTLTEQVEPDRIGAVCADHLPRIDHVAAALRHLLPVHVQHVLVHDHVLVDQRVERRHADREQ